MELLTILRSDSTAKLIGGVIGVIILLIISAIKKGNKNSKASKGSNTSTEQPVVKDSNLDKVLENQKKLDDMNKKEDDSIWK